MLTIDLVACACWNEEIAEIVERQVVETEPPCPGFGRGRLQQHQIRQHNRQHQNEQAIAEKHPAPGSEPHGPALAALAGQRDVAPPAEDGLLEQEQCYGHQQQRNGIGCRHLELKGIAEELPQLQRHEIDARRQRDHDRRADDRDRLQEDDDSSGEDRGQHQRQRHAPGQRHAAGAEDIGGVLHLARDHLQRADVNTTAYGNE